MKINLLSTAFAITGVLLSGASEAMTMGFDVGSGSTVDTRQSRFWGANIETALDPGLSDTSFSLAPGESKEFDFFDISLSNCRLVCGGTASIDASLDLTAPETTASGQGLGSAASLAGWITAGSLYWDTQPGTFHTEAGDFSVFFRNLHGLGFGSRYTVTATVANLSPIPIPGTGWLFGTALIGLTAATRLRRARARAVIRA